MNKRDMYEKYLKRAFDFVISLTAFIILLPLIAATSFLIRINLGSPIIFKQKRPGLNENLFTLYKFRTMNDKKDENGVLLPDSIRLTRFGKILRSTSIDELPSLINIIKGDMSLVGPRPLLVQYLPFYKANEKKRHSVRPGLTGLSQIKGRNNLDWNERLMTDVFYTESISFLSDIKIIVKTVMKVIKREDINVVDISTLKDLNEVRERND